MSLLLALLVGFALGLRHATDADHVAAIGAMLRATPTLRGALRTGALWGLGHSVTVLAVGAAMVVAGLRFSPGALRTMELVVAAMLIALGLLNLRRVAGAAEPAAPRPPWRPLAVGVVHGLAGSAGTTLLALTTVREPVAAVAYLVLFGVGTVLGMMALTAALAGSLAATARRSARLHDAILAAASLASVAVGCAVAAEALGA